MLCGLRRAIQHGFPMCLQLCPLSLQNHGNSGNYGSGKRCFPREIRHAQYVRDVEAAGSIPVIPTIFRNEAFGEIERAMLRFTLRKNTQHGTNQRQTIDTL